MNASAKVFFLVWSVFSIVAGVFGICYTLNNNGIFTRIKAGDVWLYEFKAKNPFEEKVVLTNYVVEVKDGYVKYSCQGRYRVESSRLFIFRSTRISKGVEK